MFSDDISQYERLLTAFESVDYFHQSVYQLLEAERLNGRFVFFKSDTNDAVLIPFIERKFIVDGHEYKDLTMAYGYPSPLISTVELNSTAVFDAFLNELAGHHYVSAFIRHNPFVTSKTENYFGAEDIGTIRVVELLKDIADIRKLYRKVHRRDITGTTALGITTTNKVLATSDVDCFIETYHETMDRLSANQSYYFSSEYLSHLLSVENYEIRLLEARLESELLASSLFIYGGCTAHYYLSATPSHKLRGYGSKAVIDEAIRYGCSQGYKLLNLGGGLGGEVDSLFHFKKGFGGVDMKVYCSKIVPNRELYEYICSTTVNSTGAVFPNYQVDYY